MRHGRARSADRVISFEAPAAPSGAPTIGPELLDRLRKLTQGDPATRLYDIRHIATGLFGHARRTGASNRTELLAFTGSELRVQVG